MGLCFRIRGRPGPWHMPAKGVWGQVHTCSVGSVQRPSLRERMLQAYLYPDLSGSYFQNTIALSSRADSSTEHTCRDGSCQ